ncbi:MAG: wax ester/triacylglycerol synthase family O-acyltransferase [Oscillochloris sp.]|nr:wax ester/triacylglycerol synthase family O-acyltransferase [Oscillochloris sp.]
MSPNEHARTSMDSVDAAWLHMDEPTNLMVVTICTIFDEPLDFGLLKSTVERRLLPFARARQRVVVVNGQPGWEPDQHFSLGYHVRRVGVPGGGDDAGLLELISDMMSVPLDPAKPLWQITLAERYGKGCAVITRLHHCIGDGVAIGRMLGGLLDESPTPGESVPIRKRTKQPPQSPLAALGAAIESIGAAMRTSESVLNNSWETVTHPDRALDIAGRSVGAASKIALMPPDSRTVFKGALSVEKRAAWTTPVPLAKVKAAGKLLGGTVNDVMVSAMAGGLRRYLLARGQSAESLTVRGMMPVNLLPPGAAPSSGNHFGMVYVGLPVSIKAPADRIAAVQRETAAIKSSPEAALGYGILSAMGVTPLGVEHAMLDLLCSRATAVITNVVGPTATLYLCGKPVKRTVFWVPQASKLGLGLSIFSYAGHMHMGIASDAGLVPDAAALAAAVDAEIQDLVGAERAVGGTPAAKTRSQEAGRRQG